MAQCRHERHVRHDADTSGDVEHERHAGGYCTMPNTSGNVDTSDMNSSAVTSGNVDTSDMNSAVTSGNVDTSDMYSAPSRAAVSNTSDMLRPEQCRHERHVEGWCC
jgi:hypothetical protein